MCSRPEINFRLLIIFLKIISCSLKTGSVQSEEILSIYRITLAWRPCDPPVYMLVPALVVDLQVPAGGVRAGVAQAGGADGEAAAGPPTAHPVQRGLAGPVQTVRTCLHYFRILINLIQVNISISIPG